MREGYYGNVIQKAREEMTPITEAQSSFSDNRELIAIAQSEGVNSEEALERLICSNRGLVKNIALRFCDRGVDMDDLMQIGTIGMIKAIRSFDLERGTCFSTYAVPLIFGEIRRHMRDEGPMKVGRQYKRLGAAIVNHKNRIMAEEGREAHIYELAALCGVDVEEVAMALEATAPIVSLSELAYGDDDSKELEDTLADSDSILEMQRFLDKLSVSEAIATLPSDWRKIITLRYFRNMTQQQVAEHLGITQVKVSREEKKILEELRKRLSV